jgi:hypothetical protein
LEQARADAATFDETSNHLPTPKARDWHAQRTKDEPRCAADQWRTRDRAEVLFISEMSDQHLGHCIRFASTKRQHRSRWAALLAERAARNTTKGPSHDRD